MRLIMLNVEEGWNTFVLHDILVVMLYWEVFTNIVAMTYP